MNKKVKYLAYAIAVVLVAGIMTVAIWAATSASAGISANVSWTASAGIEFELEAWVVNNPAGNGIGNTSTPKSISKQIVTASTSNTSANNLAGDLACGFYDGTNDGVNNPSNIVFTYKIKNTGSGILKVTATKTPNNQAESGTTAANHKPAVALSSKLNSSDNTSSCISSITTSGFSILSGKTLEYIVTLSIANADLSISSFDAGVTFNFGTGSIEAGTPTIYVNGVQQSSPGIDGAITVGDYLDALDGSQYPGYFYDEDLTIYANEDDIVTNDTKLYTKPATLDALTFTSNGDGTCIVYSASEIVNSPFGFEEEVNAASGDIVIPRISPEGDIITCVTGGAFEGCSNLTSITIPDSVTSIGDYAFEICTSLTSITIPDSVTSIGSYAFNGCSGLTNISIGNSVTSIGDYAFNNCTGLTSITIPDSVTSIGDYAFNNCTGLTSITIPDSVTSMGNYAFSYCTSLTSITIGNSVTSIGDYAFNNCTGLIDITIPDSVTSIGSNAFEGCTSLTSIYIPSSVTTITASRYLDSPFYGCSSSLKIYCGASSKPSGWDDSWNRYDYRPTNTLSVTWGVTREQYNSQYA